MLRLGKISKNMEDQTESDMCIIGVLREQSANINMPEVKPLLF
jgi:hypothetical protein